MDKDKTMDTKYYFGNHVVNFTTHYNPFRPIKEGDALRVFIWNSIKIIAYTCGILPGRP